ncbi:CDP-diacylglycerol--serine O-phosphatidyltransferase [Marinihelvus fidelis]|uniref:CDP-diacylglycerol--serine O-phosphatidyltransferase n=1 Tax=Marinihelvus fidelis TaxID=2613842 RepID=A0A5N0T8H7_9GAMM|nr:CDP-diacylglycerol--serine O-phosphatidyltransferase [Marinihelvus fidelis]KAA9130794.1 CDP-diacylglycerol--serine O-phosphatidyltransferase [Marinihelvus fidelis]
MDSNGKIPPKGAFLLPNLLTTCALFAGVYSIISGINGQYEAAAIAIGIAGVLDGLDGRVARLTNTQSEFGVQFDSLSDMISFGLAPAMLAFNWSLQSLGHLGPMAGKLGWLAAFVYIACAALRLARFNAQAGKQDKTYFQGLASPAAALTLAVTIWFFVDNGIDGEQVSWLIWFATVTLGLLMFSSVRYFSFKSMGGSEKVPMAWIFALVLLLVLFSVDPPAVGMVAGTVYVLSGIIMTLAGRRSRLERRARRRRLARRRQAEKAMQAEERGPDS